MDSTILIAILAIIPPLILIWIQTKNRRADTTKLVSEAYSNLASDLRLEINRLSIKIDKIEEESNELLIEIIELKIIISNLKTILETYIKIEGDLREGVITLRKQIIEDYKREPNYELPLKINFDTIEKE
jgi:hypothetical protein